MTENIAMLLQGMWETLYMTIASVVFSYLLGLPLGVLFVSTSAHGIAPHRKLHTVLGWIIDIGRSIPFIILIVELIPVTRAIVGKVIGPTAAIVPLVIAATPFVARMVETSLEEVDHGVVEANDGRNRLGDHHQSIAAGIGSFPASGNVNYNHYADRLLGNGRRGGSQRTGRYCNPLWHAPL